MRHKTAIILFNLGGPSDLKAVKPFLFNLFNDPAIINYPQPFRYFLAKLISSRREAFAQKIYKNIGGKSPIFPETEKQVEALEKTLLKKNKDCFKVFINMRYSHPFADEVIEDVQKYVPNQIIMLPLYPQYSSTTTESSVNNFIKYYKKAGLKIPYKIIREYPDHPLFIEAHGDKIIKVLKKIDLNKYRILFSAHGLPKKIVDKGDIYPAHIKRTCKAIIKFLHIKKPKILFDHVICYQSKVGRLEWIGPSTEDEILRAGRDGKNVIIVPVAFVSEHSETLVELDIEYKELAEKAGIKDYIRIATLSCDKKFIESLAMLILEQMDA